MEFDDQLLAPLFHGAWHPEKAAAALWNPSVSAWLKRICDGKFRNSKALRFNFADAETFFGDVASKLWDRARQHQGFIVAGGGPANSPKAFVMRVALNLITDFARQAVVRERRLAPQPDNTRGPDNLPDPTPRADANLIARHQLKAIADLVRSDAIGGAPARKAAFLILAMPNVVQLSDIQPACGGKDGFARDPETTLAMLQKHIIRVGDSPLDDPELERVVAWILRCADASVTGGWDHWQTVAPADARRGLDLVQRWFRRVRDDLKSIGEAS
jgi:hypothetical protein